MRFKMTYEVWVQGRLFATFDSMVVARREACELAQVFKTATEIRQR